MRMIQISNLTVTKDHQFHFFLNTMNIIHFFFDIVYIAMAEKGALKRGLRTWAGKEEQQKLLCKRSLKYQLDQLMTFCFGNAIKILLIGKTGVGKSHLTNALIGEQLAEEGKDFDPKTAEASFTEL